VGGTVQVDSLGVVSIAGLVSVDGIAEPSPEMTLAGLVDIVGCTVAVCSANAQPPCPGTIAGTLSSLGPRGINRITGRDLAVVLGTMRARTDTGRNELIYDGADEREPLVAGQVTPDERIIVDTSVLPCPRCGNRIIEPPETCDDGNTESGDGCTATCQIEQPIPGDANGDRQLSEDDRLAILLEIYDGDGDLVSMVEGGAFRGAPGADANADEHVTIADVIETARLLRP
jgi:cysteine-rich repeat protein